MAGPPSSDVAAALTVALARATGGEVVVENLERVVGGSSRETWAFELRRPDASVEPLILRRDPAGAELSGLRLEAQLLRAAARQGAPVPRVVLAGEALAGLGEAIVMERVPGETIPRRILRDDALADARGRFATECGVILAAIHRIPVAEAAGLPAGDPLEQLRQIIDRLGQPHPTFELALRRLAAGRPPRSAQVVVHGDFRLGNLIMGADGIRAVLDWELAHIGDPIEDLGWLCVKAWRFGGGAPVGGLGPVEDLLQGYGAAGGLPVDRATLSWWETLGTLRWGVICMVQAFTHLSGAVRSVELAAIGRRVCEVEWDLLELLDPSGETPAPSPAVDPAAVGGAPHDAPSIGELLVAVREFLAGDVSAATTGRVRFHARVAANAVDIVFRELARGDADARRHAASLEHLGLADERALAAAIRSGALDDRSADTVAVLRQTVAAKLAAANPRHLLA